MTSENSHLTPFVDIQISSQKFEEDTHFQTGKVESMVLTFFISSILFIPKDRNETETSGKMLY